MHSRTERALNSAMAHVHARRIRSFLATSDAEIVLVDYFDTLVDRRCSSGEVKADAARRLSGIGALPMNADRSLELRRQGELAASTARTERGDDHDYSLPEAARHVAEAADVADPEALVDAMVRCEVAAELSAQRLRTPIVDALADDGRLLALVSDFHLPEAAFRRMLAAHDIESLFSRVIVSCDHRRTKATGRLFDVTATLLGTPRDRLAMIGDNPISDVERARAAGLRPLHVPRAHAGRLGRFLP